MRLAFATIVLVLGAACGSSAGDLSLPGETDPGTGSQTLGVSGSVEANQSFDNASDPNDFSTTL
jgi:hypothetical protein